MPTFQRGRWRPMVDVRGLIGFLKPASHTAVGLCIRSVALPSSLADRRVSATTANGRVLSSLQGEDALSGRKGARPYLVSRLGALRGFGQPTIASDLRQ